MGIHPIILYPRSRWAVRRQALRDRQRVASDVSTSLFPLLGLGLILRALMWVIVPFGQTRTTADKHNQDLPHISEQIPSLLRHTVPIFEPLPPRTHSRDFGSHRPQRRPLTLRPVAALTDHLQLMGNIRAIMIGWHEAAVEGNRKHRHRVRSGY